MNVLSNFGISLLAMVIFLFGFDMQRFLSVEQIGWVMVLIPLTVTVIMTGFVEPLQDRNVARNRPKDKNIF